MENKQLEKSLGVAAALSTVVGMVIGGGVFFKPQAVYTLTGGAPGLGMLVWVLAGIVTIAAGLTAAEVSAAIPKTGGMMVYIEEIYGKKLGFLTGWMQSVLFFPATIAALAVMFGQQSAGLLGNESLSMPIALGIILLISVLNNISSKAGGMIQTVSTVGKLLPLILIMIFGFIKGEGNNPIVQPMVAEGVNPMSIIGQLLIAVLFTKPINGATSWFEITDTLKFQPSELAKIFVIMFLATIMVKLQERNKNDINKVLSAPGSI